MTKALEKIFYMLGLKLRLPSIMTLRSHILSTTGTTFSQSVKTASLFQPHMSTVLHYSLKIGICHLLAHATILFNLLLLDGIVFTFSL